MAAKVSIIVPVYNQQAYVKQCLQSLLTQTLQEIEIICINDGSTDDSLSIIEQFARSDKRLLIINQPNQGAGAARNIGISSATGEYIGFVDPDDFVDADYFEQLYNRAKETSAEICCSVCRKEITADGCEREVKTPMFKDAEKFKKQLVFTAAHLWSKIFLRQFVQKHHFQNANSNHSQDLAFSIPAILLADTICWVEDTCYYYRVLPTSSSRKNIIKQDCIELPQIYNRMLAHSLSPMQSKVVIEKLKNNALYYLKRIGFINQVLLFKHIIKVFPCLIWTRDYMGAYVCARILNQIGI